jgi:hypothetical protein
VPEGDRQHSDCKQLGLPPGNSDNTVMSQKDRVYICIYKAYSIRSASVCNEFTGTPMGVPLNGLARKPIAESDIRWRGRF